MLCLKPQKEEDVGAIQEHGETWLHRHGMDILNSGGDARDFDKVAPDMSGHVS